MRVTRAEEYAIRCAYYLTKQNKELITRRKEIAEAMDIPDQFLGKIAQQLARAGIIEIVQGAKGGFRLTALPEKLSLLDVVEAVSGTIFLNDCVLRPGSCRRSDTCAVHALWVKAKDQLRSTLRKATFSRLAKQENFLNRISKKTGIRENTAR
ncbi:MAG TPA: Rrf2 family transcriptional regulator [Thermodesulfobacteriota bacterium]|nr:Rrf2 family transcriptional regulator [Deltaproteobacteria bacterium]HNR12934.1 Rrf2 family transcriptional regulator [Thermodesulfobacteriota bacterium]HNU72603.1 Rrf2 family transcriptional regulator [Thermodesulfobacteriota bacterium]